MLPALVAQRAQLVQLAADALADEATVAGEERRLVDEVAGEPVRETVGGLEAAPHPGERRLPGQHFAQPLGPLQRLGDGQEVARAAAAEAEAGERPLQVRAAAQRLANLVAQRFGISEALDRVEPGADR